MRYLLPSVWIAAILGVVYLSDSFNNDSEHFFGVVENKEQAISFQYPVEIVQASVVKGESVEIGELILEVRRQELASSESAVDEEIRKFKLERNESKNAISSRIKMLKAQKKATLADLNYEIHQAESRLALNRKALLDISGLDINDMPPSPEMMTLADLKEKRDFSTRAIEAEMSNLKKQLYARSRPVDAQIALLENNKAEIQRLNKSLHVKAKFNGLVGNLNFKTGDLVPAFQPIMTIYSEMPRTVNGYINENISNNIQVGQEVWVKPMMQSKARTPIRGVVESLGSRIVEYPDRLKKVPTIQAWGREARIYLLDEHTLILGEKVDILLEHPVEEMKMKLPFLKEATAANISPKHAHALETTFSNNSEIDINEIEASGVLWDAKQQQYLVVSDEQYQKQPGIFTMNNHGLILDQLDFSAFDINIDDLESIATDGEYIYASSSLSYNKNNKRKAKRRQLLRFKYSQNKVLAAEVVDFSTVLNNIKNIDTHSPYSQFIAQATNDRTIDIEGMFIKDYALYLGFKSPRLDNKAMILKLGNVDSIFKLQETTAAVWQTLALNDPSNGELTQLSDMHLMNDHLYLLSVKEKGSKGSYLWQFNLASEQLSLLEKFEGANAEGLAYNADTNSMMIMFDEGNHHASTFKQMRLDEMKAL